MRVRTKRRTAPPNRAPPDEAILDACANSRLIKNLKSMRTCVRDFSRLPGYAFRRAVERRSLKNAELAAREMSQVSLEDALALVVLYAEQDETRFEKAAVRWLGMLFLEKPLPISLAAQCVELVSQLRAPEAERVAKALGALAKG